MLLGAYKYLDFLLVQFGLGQAVTGLVAPLGISFFTFKCIAYLADVYHRRIGARPSFWAFALYVSFFPQIAMGPITRYGEFAPQLNDRSVTLQTTASGIRRFEIFGHLLAEFFNPGDYYDTQRPAWFVRWQIDVKF